MTARNTGDKRVRKLSGGSSGDSLFRKILCYAGSPYVTAVLLFLATVLLFFATLSELANGQVVAHRAFYGSVFALWRWPATSGVFSQFWIILPGGPLLGALFAINLLAAGCLRIRQVCGSIHSLIKGDVTALALFAIHAGVFVVIAGYFMPILGAGNGFFLAGAGGAVTVAALMLFYLPSVKDWGKCICARVRQRGSLQGNEGLSAGSGVRSRVFWSALIIVPLLWPIVSWLTRITKELDTLYFSPYTRWFSIVLIFSLHIGFLLSLGSLFVKKPGQRRMFAAITFLLAVSIMLYTGLAVNYPFDSALATFRSVVVICCAGASYFALLIAWRMMFPLMAFCGYVIFLISYYWGASLSLGSFNHLTISKVSFDRYWLILHVLVISAGYAATLFGVVVANFALISHIFNRKTGREKMESMSRMLGRAMHVALFFVSAGTFTGALWASSAWGRFWGWDPKENAALMLILWIALTLHSLRGRIVGTLGFVRLVALGGLVLYWSWAGTTMIGIGLHAYQQAVFPRRLEVNPYVFFQLIIIVVSILYARIRAKSCR